MKYWDGTRTVEAIQWTGRNTQEVKKLAPDVLESPVLEFTKQNPSGRYLQVPTPFGWRIARPSDWIVKDTYGHCWPYEQYVFEKVYQPVGGA